MVVPSGNQKPMRGRFSIVPLLIAAFIPDMCAAARTVPGEARVGFFFTLTHLHPLVYVILAVILVLSVINLIVQGWAWSSSSPFVFLLDLWGRLRGGSAGTTVLRGLKSRKQEQGRERRSRIETSYRYGQQPREDSVVSVRRLSKVAAQNARTSIPTPLDGVNHPLPEFSLPQSGGTGAPRIVESKTETKPPPAEFKFTSAVDFPSPEEIERREKTQLAISGCVRDPEGRGIASVIVYLVDAEGNRLGQSCRSAADTGEFKVLANEAGKYRLGGYKRGYVMESADPLPLPIEAGKIEGFNFVMRAEGCEVKGRVVFDPGGEAAADYEVRCDCRRDDFSRSARANAQGEFQIVGVPQDSECTLTLLKPDGTSVSRSEPFQTVQKKEVYREIRVVSAQTSAPEAGANPFGPEPEPGSGTEATDPSEVAVSQATASHD